MRDPRLAPGHPNPADVTLSGDGPERIDVYVGPDVPTTVGRQRLDKSPAATGGAQDFTGTTVGTLVTSGAVTGQEGAQGTAVGTLATSGSATGTVGYAGTAAGSIATSGTAAGVEGSQGTAIGSITLTGLVSGTKSESGTPPPGGAPGGGRGLPGMVVFHPPEPIQRRTGTVAGTLVTFGAAHGVGHPNPAPQRRRRERELVLAL